MAGIVLGRADKVQRQHDSRDNLRGDGRDGRTLNAPVEDENINRVKYGIECRANEHAVHGHARMAVGTCEVGQHDTDEVKRGTQQDDARIVYGIGHDVLGRTEQRQNGLQKDQTERHEHKAECDGEAECVIERLTGFVLVLLTQSNGGVRRAARTDHGTEGEQNGHQRKGNRRRGVAQIADALTNKNLVDNVINGVNQAGNNRRKRKIDEQPSDRQGA